MRWTLCGTGVALWAQVASACGGLFCSGATTVGVPVDQNAERVVFEIDDDSVTTHVQLQVAGDAQDFAWIVPLPAVPTFGTTPQSWLDFLDQMTTPQFTLPQADFSSCPTPSSAPSRGGLCSGSSASATTATRADDGSAAPDGSAVIHYGTQVFGEYVADVVGSPDTAAVVAWLREHDYNITDNMLPALSSYNKPGMVFAALKLSRPNGGEALTPVSFKVPGGEPCVPLRLTAVSAQPLMGVQVTILDDRAWIPTSGSFEPIDPAGLSLYADGSTNYFAWVARRTAEAGGQHFIQERIVTLPAFNESLARNPKASRYYTRLSPEDMTFDPIFAPAPTLDDTAAVDLSGHQPLWGCLSAEEIAQRTPPPCAGTFCGEGATCVDDAASQTAGCVCPAGQVAQQLTDPQGKATVTCVASQNALGVTDETVGAGGAFDPCATVDCGRGACVLRGGFPTCACDTGMLATIGDAGTPTCGERPANAVNRGAGVPPPTTWRAPPSQRPTPPVPWGLLGLFVLLGAAFVARTTRRHRRGPAPRAPSTAGAQIPTT